MYLLQLHFNQPAKELLAKYSGGIFPVHIITIANELGIEVFSDSKYPAQNSGHIEIDHADKASIIVNDKDSSTFFTTYCIGLYAS